MVQELRLLKFVDGVHDMPFPNNESDDEQIVITSFTYNAQRMAATPTITASIDYYRCLDNDWNDNVYAEYKGEKYYIRQTPSSSKSNTSVMYKHDITLYSERFVLENVYFVDVDRNVEDTNVVIRCNLEEFTHILNNSLSNSNLNYVVEIDENILTNPNNKYYKVVRETKDIVLENAYLSQAIQEIYNQWEVPFYFSGNTIIVKDTSEDIDDYVLEYGADESLLSIKKNNANFRKITRISGYGSDRNIPFYYPNWSQKGIIDVEPLESNSGILTKDMLTITDMKRFDKKMPLNGVVKWKKENDVQPQYSGNTTFPQVQLKYGNKTQVAYDLIIPFESVRENNSSIEITFKVNVRERHFPTKPDVEYNMLGPARGDLLYSPLSFEGSYIYDADNTDNKIKFQWEAIQLTSTITSYTRVGAPDSDNGTMIDQEMTISLTNVGELPKGNLKLALRGVFSVNDAIKRQDVIGTYRHYYSSGFGSTRKDYTASINSEKDSINLQISNIEFKYPNIASEEGWYLNDTKKINLADIGISVNGTPNDSWNNEGFYQKGVSKIPTMPYLMPSLYRESLGNQKFYNAIDNTYKDENGEYYDFTTEWNEVNQNEHIQPFEEIYPSITNVTNANNEPIDEILEVAFDDNDNNEVDEEGNYIHPYFYVRIPVFNGDNGFNLFDHKIVGENMQVSMTSGDCSACSFEIKVLTQASDGNETYEDVRNPIFANNDNTLPSGDWQQKVTEIWNNTKSAQQDSSQQSIWLVLKKDNDTFNETYPNTEKNVVPKVGDKFVLLNIDMPRSYVLEAEKRLEESLIKYMWENNSDKWNFQIDFSRIFLQENQSFYERLDENSRLYVKYNDITYTFYVNDYKYEVKANEALPKITVGLVDTITISKGITQNIVDGVMKAFYQMFEIDSTPEERDRTYVRKNVDETMPNNMTFDKDVNIKGELEANSIKTPTIQSPKYSGDEIISSGFELKENENGESTLTVDYVNVRKKLNATEFAIKQIQFQGGIVIQSAAGMECSSVEEIKSGDNVAQYKCYFDTKNGSVSNQFVIGDLARCQRVGYAPKYYWRVVVDLGDDYILLSNSVGEYDENSDAPSAGDIIVQLGNADAAFTNRQSAIVMDTTGENAPSFIMYSGIDWFSLEGKDVTGIVYHQRETLEDGSEVGGYPELYSYGSMYFGDRAKTDNFIKFEKNPQTNKYEMVIKAKSVFNSAFQDGSTIVDGGLVITNVLSTNNSGINGLNNNKPVFWAGSTYANSDNAPFRVHNDGSLYASKGVFEGYIKTNIYTPKEIDFNVTRKASSSGSGIAAIKVSDHFNLRTDLLYENNNQNELTIVLPKDTSFIGSRIVLWNGCIPPYTRAEGSIRYSNVVTESNYGILGYFDGSDEDLLSYTTPKCLRWINGTIEFLGVPINNANNNNNAECGWTIVSQNVLRIEIKENDRTIIENYTPDIPSAPIDEE